LLLLILPGNDSVPGCCRATETKCLGDAQIDREEAWALAEVARDDLFAGPGIQIEIAKSSDLQVSRESPAGSKCRPLPCKRIAIGVEAGCDVEWRARGHDDEWTESYLFWQADCGKHKAPVTHVK